MNTSIFRSHIVEDPQTQKALSAITHLQTISKIITQNSTSAGRLVITELDVSWNSEKCDTLTSEIFSKIETFQKLNQNLSNFVNLLNPHDLEEDAFGRIHDALIVIFKWSDAETKKPLSINKDSTESTSNDSKLQDEFDRYLNLKMKINSKFNEPARLRSIENQSRLGIIENQSIVNNNFEGVLYAISDDIRELHTAAQSQIKQGEMPISNIESYIVAVTNHLNDLDSQLKTIRKDYSISLPVFKEGFKWSELNSIEVKKFFSEAKILKQMCFNLEEQVMKDVWNAENDTLSILYQFDEIQISLRLPKKERIKQLLNLCEKLSKYCQDGKTSQNIALAFSRLAFVLGDLKIYKDEQDQCRYQLFNLKNFPACWSELKAFEKDCFIRKDFTQMKELQKLSMEVNKYNQNTYRPDAIEDFKAEINALEPLMARYALIQEQFENLQQSHPSLAMNETKSKYKIPLKVEFNGPLFQEPIHFSSHYDLIAISSVYRDYIKALKNIYIDAAWISRFLQALPSLEFPRLDQFKLFG